MWWLPRQREADIAASAVCSDATVEFIRKWHERLGHVNYRKLCVAMQQIHMDFGDIPLNVKLKDKCVPENRCRACALAKSHAIAHPPRPIVKRSIILQKGRVPNPEYEPDNDKRQGFGPGCVSTDLIGPYTEKSFSSGYVGNQTFIILDSKYVMTYGYSHRSDAYNNLKKFVRDIKLLGLKMTSYHIDNAKELQSIETKEYLSEQGIKVTATSPYTPQENAFSERHNRTEDEAVIAMMQHARFIPKEFWFEAKRAFTHMYNRLPTTTSKGVMSCRHTRMLQGRF